MEKNRRYYENKARAEARMRTKGCELKDYDMYVSNVRELMLAYATGAIIIWIVAFILIAK